MQLSTHFKLEEFLRSEVAARMGRPITIDDPQIQTNLVDLCEEILEPLRLLFNASITIWSGYRPDWCNTMVGGSKNSAHMYGRAADIIVTGITPMEVSRAVAQSTLPCDQVIFEFGQWTHVAIAEVGVPPRREVLTAIHVDGETTYRSGIVNA